jgi:SNF2 family DNA or RNA helicase
VTITAERGSLRGEDVIWLHSDDSYRDKERIKLVPGSGWTKEAGPDGLWHVPLSWAACLQLRGIFGDELRVADALLEWSTNEHARRVAVCANLRLLTDAPGWGPEGLRDDQRVGVAMLFTAEKMVLGDDMGTGKTVMGACALDLVQHVHGDAFPALVVCPNTVKRGWQREIEKWAPGVRVAVLRGTATQRRAIIDAVAAGEHDVLVMNWENLKNHSRLAPYGSVSLRTCEVCDPTSIKKQASCEHCERELNAIDWHTVILDEAHRAKDPKAKQTRAAWRVIHNSPSCRYAWALTGTVIADALDDFWSIGHAVAPHEYPSKTKFIERYGLQTWNAFGGMEIVGIQPQTRDEFFAFYDPRFLRRPRQYSLAHLKEPIRVDRFAEMSPKQRKLYVEVAEEMIGRLDDGDIVLASNPLTQNARLYQAAAAFLDKRDCDRCNTTGQKPGSHEPAPHPDPAYSGNYCYCAAPLDDPRHKTKCTACGGNGHQYWPMAPSNKIDDLLNFLGETNDQVVVFTVSRKLAELTGEVLAAQKPPISHTFITGRIPEEQRYRNVDEFRAGQHRVCLVVIAAGGEGLDGLQCAQTGVFLQRDYADWRNKQAEGRLLRDGQEGQVVFVDIRSEGTLEDDQEVILAQKQGRFEELVRDRETLRRLLAIRPEK